MSGEVVVVSGPSGAGKSTVAAILARTAERPTVHVVTDQFFDAIKTGFIAPYLPDSEHQNDVVVAAYLAAVAVYARGGYDVVVDGVIGPWYLASFQKLAAEGVPVSYVVLRPALHTTLARAQGRGPEALREAEPITGLHGAFADLGEFEHHALDTTGQDAAATADAVRAMVTARSHLLT